MFVPIKVSGERIGSVDSEVEFLTFKQLGLKESHLEEYLRRNIETVLGDEESLLIVGQQVHNSGGGISDLTAIDKNGSIVLIEIKRDKEDMSARREGLEFQAIRYAASYAKIASPDELVDKVYARYIEKYKAEHVLGDLTATERGKRIINDFLEKNRAVASFNKRQRIILIASGFDAQTLAAVSWLISNNVDISCFEVAPAKHVNQLFLRIEKLLPPETIEDFYLDIHKSESARVDARSPGGKRAYKPRIKEMMDWKCVKSGDKLVIYNHSDSESEAEILDSQFVKFKGEKLKFNDWGQRVTGWSSICIYEWAVHKPTGKTLDQLRVEKQLEIAKGEAAA